MLSTATAQIAGAQNNPAPNRAFEFYNFYFVNVVCALVVGRLNTNYGFTHGQYL